MKHLLLATGLWLMAVPAMANDQVQLEAYLNAPHEAGIERVEVGKDQLMIRGKVPASGRFFLAELPMERSSADSAPLIPLQKIESSPDGTFTLMIPRKAQPFDRLMGRWQIIRQDGAGSVTASAFHYPDQIFCESPPGPEIELKTKKGLGGWTAGRIPGELDDLGIDAVTVNVVLSSLISLTAEEQTEPFAWQGSTYYAREQELAKLDETFKAAAKRGAMVSAILLIPNPARANDPLLKILGHPDADPHGIFAMPNLTTKAGVHLYGAILDLMARRWIRDAAEHGRVHHWIMHNEVDAGWEWTNAGEKSAIEYLELYHRSMRMMDLIARQYDPHSRPLISLTHWWQQPGNPHWYGSKQLLDLLARFNQSEGNFGWGIAFHPYPEDLFEPKTWNDHQSDFTFATAQITPRNLEVLDAYLRQPAFLDHGKIRPVQLSENGFNSRDYSAATLAEQAAGMAFAWKKISKLPSIQTWEYHNWIDNRGEGGLRIGLRKFPDDADDPLGKKPIWHLYQSLGTSEEDRACAPYLKVIGIDSWESIMHAE
ncbi:hypothetical protein JIN85_14120 [Luteolibacter pohnpeiensis]|uniref:DUF5722 domain-containing protein n=1 Tax=Luteolibacter pohnpeiensis TaxID=454153 RepID=A0A934S6J1_9BACT|nr:DUF5722 domain-containing protein [Luteolibacter pohnpeiensis]MBK1883556.1 hypothetical protein [Luteolibacter pohnpeiensis]